MTESFEAFKSKLLQRGAASVPSRGIDWKQLRLVHEAGLLSSPAAVTALDLEQWLKIPGCGKRGWRWFKELRAACGTTRTDAEFIIFEDELIRRTAGQCRVSTGAVAYRQIEIGFKTGLFSTVDELCALERAQWFEQPGFGMAGWQLVLRYRAAVQWSQV